MRKPLVIQKYYGTDGRMDGWTDGPTRQGVESRVRDYKSGFCKIHCLKILSNTIYCKLDLQKVSIQNFLLQLRETNPVSYRE